jgi:hypothetical protein
VNIHLNSGADPEDQAARLRQLERYVYPLMDGAPTLVVGDSNLDTSALSMPPGISNALEGKVTCSDEGKHILNGKPKEDCNECEERIDVALFDSSKLTLSDIEILPGHSDHHLVSLTVG